MKFKNMKIAITDEVHLKAVCDVLESVGVTHDIEMSGNQGTVAAIGVWDDMTYCTYKTIESVDGFLEVTLTDLLAMRDQLFMEYLK